MSALEFTECVIEPVVDKFTGKLTHGKEPINAFDLDGKKNWISANGELITGVFLDMPAAEYHKIKAVSSSLIKRMAFDPQGAEKYWRGEEEHEMTPQRRRAYNSGHLLHGLILEPDIDHGVVAPLSLELLAKKTGNVVIENHDNLKKYLNDNGLPKGKNIADRVAIAVEHSSIIFYPYYLDDFKQRENRGERTLSLEDFNRVTEAVDTFKTSTAFKLDYENGGYSELTVIAYDTERECYVKARIDRITDDGLMRDLKTIHTLSEDDIRRDLETRLYMVQGAFYHYVCNLIGFDFVKPNEFGLTFIEWDQTIRFQTVEVDRGSWDSSVGFMLEIFDDLMVWLGTDIKKNSLNKSQSLVLNLSYYKLKRRPRVLS